MNIALPEVKGWRDGSSSQDSTSCGLILVVAMVSCRNWIASTAALLVDQRRLAVGRQDRAVVGGDDLDRVADQNLGLLALPEIAEIDIAGLLRGGGDGRHVGPGFRHLAAMLFQHVLAVIEHARIHEPGKGGQLAAIGTGIEGAGEVGAALVGREILVERQRPAGGGEAGDPDHVLAEHVGRAGAAGELLHQALVDLGGGTRRRQFDVLDQDAVLRFVEGLDQVAEGLLAEEGGAGEADFGAGLGASPANAESECRAERRRAEKRRRHR